MSTTVLVVDTSYLLEVLKVPKLFDPSFAERVKQRFGKAIKGGHRLFVPFPVVFEVANHIAGVRDDGLRKGLAKNLAKTIRSSVQNSSPWIITPAAPGDVLFRLSELLSLCEVYAQDMVARRVGLSDTAIIEEARRLKDKYNQPGDRVHIWTRDHGLKAYEPDPEPEPLLS
jgi:predicted nucleic acid-binding protein